MKSRRIEAERANHGLQPTRLSWLDFGTGFVIVSGSEQESTPQTRLAAEPNR